MHIQFSSDESTPALIVIRNTINDILARREHASETPRYETKPAAPDLTVAPPTEKTVITSVASPPAPSDPAAVHPADDKADTEAPKRGRGRPPKVTKTISRDEVRLLMIRLADENGPDMLGKQKNLLVSMGFDKLSNVPDDRLVDLKEKLEKL